ncbi:hypothetical protein [Mediterranea massiliensis]|uniref:hypothetical protein n=1 Tax=Mediterranea massiliensis TaxID=1841865 RepID=UPI00266BFC21|nr:hypothetical protein [Mediterranea massiliensis]
MIDYVLEDEIEKLENWLDDLKVEAPTNILLAQRAIKRYKEDVPSCIRGLPEPDIYYVEKRKRLIREIEEKISEYRLAERRKRKEIVQIPVVPKELDTDEARAIFKRAIDAGLMNTDFQWKNNITSYQKKRFALLSSVELKIKNKWKIFGNLWNISNMCQIRDYESSEEKIKEIDFMFSKEIIDKSKMKKL